MNYKTILDNKAAVPRPICFAKREKFIAHQFWSNKFFKIPNSRLKSAKKLNYDEWNMFLD